MGDDTAGGLQVLWVGASGLWPASCFDLFLQRVLLEVSVEIFLGWYSASVWSC